MTQTERFLFAPVDRRSAAAFRVALAAFTALVFWQPVTQPWNIVSRLPVLPALYEHVFASTGYLVLRLGLLALFALGWRPRAMGLLAAVVCVPFVAGSGVSQSRQVLIFTLVAFSMLRSDGCFSIRAASSDVGPMWPIRLIQMQLSLLYGVNVIAKLTPAYLRGDVLVRLSERMPNFLVDLSSGALAVGPVGIPGWLLAVAVVVVEAVLAVGFWVPGFRVATAALGVAFHFAASFIIRIAWLGWTSMFLYLVFLLPFEAGAKDAAASRLPSP